MPLWFVIILLLLSIMAIVLFVKSIRGLRSKEYRMTAILQLMSGIIITIFMYFLQNAYQSNDIGPKEQFELPKIYSKLVIEEVGNETVRYRFQLSNIGLSTVYNLRYDIVSSVYSESTWSEREIKELRSGETITLYPVSFVVPPDLDKVALKLELIVYYNVRLENVDKEYKSTLRFFIPRVGIKIGVFEPQSILHEEDKYRQVDSNYNVFKMLNNKEGSVVLRFLEKDLHPTMPSSLISTSNILLYYSPVAKNVTLAKEMGKIMEYYSQDIKEKNDGSHVAVITWSEYETKLYVDGVEARKEIDSLR